MTALLFPLVCGAKTAGTAPSVQDAWQDARGNLIIRFSPDLALFPAGNNVFYGSNSQLRQIELTWKTASASSPSLATVHFESGLISFSEGRAQLSCAEGGETELAPLSGPALSQLESDVQRGKIALKKLPEVREPLYLLQVKGTDEYVYVTAPRYNFHQNLEVFLGRPGHLKKLELAEASKDKSERVAGQIRLKTGGNIQIPAEIDLLKPLSKDRASPTLTRSAGSSAEELIRPALKPADIKKLGIRIPGPGRAHTPCDR